MTQLSRTSNEQSIAVSAAAPVESAGVYKVNPLHALWNRKWVIVGAIVIAAGIAVFQLSRSTRIYEARSRLTIEPVGPRMLRNDATDSMPYSQNFLATQCGVITSRKIRQMVAENPNIADNQTFSGRNSTAQITEALRSILTASPGQRVDIVTVAARSPSKEDAAAIVNAAVEAYKAFQSGQKQSLAGQQLEYCRNERARVEKQLADARNAKLEFQRKNPDLVVSSDRANPTLDRLNRLSSALTDVQLDVLNAQAAYDSTKAMASDPEKMKQLLDSRQFKAENADLRRDLRELQGRMGAVGKTYLPGFPELASIQAAIKQLNDELAAEEKRVFEAYLAELEARLNTARNSEAKIQSLLNEQKAQALALNRTLAEFSIIQSEFDGLLKRAADIDQQIQELIPKAENAISASINTIEDAQPQEAAQVEPDVPFTLFKALAAGALIGSLLAIGLEWLDQRMRTPDEIKQVTGLPILGIVPRTTQRLTAVERGLLLFNDPMSEPAEAYRTIRTAVYFGAPEDSCKTLLVTSPAPGDGKTTLASNLAIAMAQAGNRVLLLDADFRKPMQHKIYQLEKPIGLSSVLAGEAELVKAIQASMVPGLDILACGPIPANPSEILNSQMFAELLDNLSDRYDQVIVDSPPVMPVTDARILAASCDATVLALRAEKSTRRAATFSRDTLRSVGARIIGVVVNDMPRRRSLYSYYYNEPETYQYGYGTSSRRGSKAAALPAKAEA